MNPDSATTPGDLFESVFAELVANYDGSRFFCERDIEWTIQRGLWRRIEELELPLAALNQYPIAPRQHLDLALCTTEATPAPVLAGVELKYEPSHARRDIARSKFDVCDYKEVGRDVERVASWVAEGRLRDGYAVLVDEGGWFKHRPPHPRAEWRELRTGRGSVIHVLWTHITSAAPTVPHDASFPGVRASS